MEEEVFVMVENQLTMDLTMDDIMQEGDVNNELGGDAYNLYKYLIQRKGGWKLTLEWDKFKDMTMNKFVCICNIHDNYIVVMKKIV